MMSEYDGTYRQRAYEPDNTTPLSDRFLVESVWICPYDYDNEDEKKPPDPADPSPNTLKHEPPDPEQAGLEYRLHLKIRAQRLERSGKATDTPVEFIHGLTEGNDWCYNSKDDSWNIPTMDVPFDDHDMSLASYDETFQMDKLQVVKCAAPTELPKTATTGLLQSDTGANANITSDLSILQDIQWIRPIECESAKKNANIEIRAIGKYTIRGTTIQINMYYCPEAHGTIISPNAVVRQHIKLFTGYQKHVNMDNDIGTITILSREGYDKVVIPIWGQNDLWYHTLSHHMPTSEKCSINCANAPSAYTKSEECKECKGHTQNTAYPYCQPVRSPPPPNLPTIRINRLSDAALWELWHQRLAHPGTQVMEQAHKDVDGVPKLRGNAFYRCPSCMSGKLCTKLPGYHHTVGTTRNGQCPHASEPLPNEIEDLIDSVYLQDAMPGQHFHVDFGFVRGSDFKIPTKKGEGPTITSIDRKNSYCLIIDRATRYIWVHISNTKEPPVEPLRMILRKFRCKATSHRTV